MTEVRALIIVSSATSLCVFALWFCFIWSITCKILPDCWKDCGDQSNLGLGAWINRAF